MTLAIFKSTSWYDRYDHGMVMALSYGDKGTIFSHRFWALASFCYAQRVHLKLSKYIVQYSHKVHIQNYHFKNIWKEMWSLPQFTTINAFSRENTCGGRLFIHSL